MKICLWDNVKKEFSKPFLLFEDEFVYFGYRFVKASDTLISKRYTKVAYPGIKIGKYECREGDVFLSPSGMYKGYLTYMSDWGKWVLKFGENYRGTDEILDEPIGNIYENPELINPWNGPTNNQETANVNSNNPTNETPLDDTESYVFLCNKCDEIHFEESLTCDNCGHDSLRVVNKEEIL